MAKIEDVIKELAALSPSDLSLVGSLVLHLRKLDGIGPEENPTDAELYWAEMAGDNQWRHLSAAPVWEELAAALKEPTKNFRKIQQLKLRLRALGEI